jgi:hypothetical protein
MEFDMMTDEQMELVRRAVEAMERHAEAMEKLANVVTFAVIAPIVIFVIIWLCRNFE